MLQVRAIAISYRTNTRSYKYTAQCLPTSFVGGQIGGKLCTPFLPRSGLHSLPLGDEIPEAIVESCCGPCTDSAVDCTIEEKGCDSNGHGFGGLVFRARSASLGESWALRARAAGCSIMISTLKRTTIGTVYTLCNGWSGLIGWLLFFPWFVCGCTSRVFFFFFFLRALLSARLRCFVPPCIVFRALIRGRLQEPMYRAGFYCLVAVGCCVCRLC